MTQLPINKPYEYQTLLLHAPADQAYRDQLERHLRFALTEQPVGKFSFLRLENEPGFRSLIEQRVERMAALVCLISHHFTTADFGYHSLIERLLRAHRKRQLRLIPVFLDNCSLRHSPLAELQRLTANQRAMNEMELAPYFQEAVAALVDEILREVAAGQAYQDTIWAAWEQAAAENTAGSYHDFLRRFPYSQFAGIARAKHEELTEKELWTTALHSGTAAGWADYLRRSPLKAHQRKATLCLLAAEIRETTARQDAERSENQGIWLDYLTRFPNGELSDKVDREARYEATQRRTDWEAAIGPLQTEADFLGYRICTDCDPREVGTFRLLERSFSCTQRKAERLQKDLREWDIIWIVLTTAPAALLIVALILAGEPVPALARQHPYWVGIGSLLSVLYCWGVHAVIRSDAEACATHRRELGQTLIELKISFLSRDAPQLRQSITRLLRAHRQLGEISKKNWLNYLQIVEWRRAGEESPDS